MSAQASTTIPSARSRRNQLGLAFRPLWIALGLIAALTFLRFSGTVDSDVAWQLWIAGRIRSGANLYTDIVETNPPLWFWMAIPVDWLATIIHARVEAVLVGSIGVLTAYSVAATDRLLEPDSSLRRTLLLGYLVLTLLAVPSVHLGQREQISLITTLPYVALIVARRDGRATSSHLAALVGAIAGIGFALKLYFLIVPVLLELWLIANRRRRWKPLRAETLAIAGVGIAYVAALFSLEGDYLKNIVPLLHLAYGAYGAPSLRYLFGLTAIVALVTIAAGACVVLNRATKASSFATALWIAAVGFVLSYFMQSKGWTYHAIPMLGFGSLALAAMVAEGKRAPRLIRIIGPALLSLPLLLAIDEYRHPDLPSRDLLQAVDGLHPGDPVGFLTTETAIPWSITLQRHYRYASRYNGFWMTAAIDRNQHLPLPDQRLVAIGRKVVSDTVADFTCIPPKRIIVWRPLPGQPAIDILPMFLRDPAFAALLSHYRVRSRTNLETYELVSPVAPPRIPCRHGV